MFCKNCGCRIPASAPKCPECGVDRPVLEYCAGFWTELNQNTRVKKQKPGADVPGNKADLRLDGLESEDNHEKKNRKPEPVVTRKDNLPANRAKPKKGGYILQIIEAAVILSLVLYSMLLGNTVKNKNNKISAMEQDLGRAKTEIQQLREKVQSAELHETDGLSQSDKLPEAGETNFELDVQPETGNTIQSMEGSQTGAGSGKTDYSEGVISEIGTSVQETENSEISSSSATQMDTQETKNTEPAHFSMPGRKKREEDLGMTEEVLKKLQIYWSN